MAARDEDIVKKDILPFLSLHIKQIMLSMPAEYLKGLEEIRLRCGQPLALRIGNKDYGLDEYGRMQEDLSRGYIVSSDDIYRSIAAISDNSLYAFEEEISRGFITIPGGASGRTGRADRNGQFRHTDYQGFLRNCV